MATHRLARAVQFMRRYWLHVVLIAALEWMGWSAILQIREHLVQTGRLVEASRALAESRVVIIQSTAQLKDQLGAAPRRALAKELQKTVVTGLKMPETPDPKWLKPSVDGKCHDPVTGERLNVVTLRGACWNSGAKLYKKEPCPEDLYEAPPEVDSEPRFQHLRNGCFQPIYIQVPKAANSDTP